MRARGRFLLCCALLAAGCGRSVRETPDGEPHVGGAGGTAGDAAGGSGGHADAASGGSPSAGTSSGGAPGASGGALGASGGAAGSAGSAEELCAGHEAVLAFNGELPNIGTDVAFHAGCPSSRIAPYSKAASFTGGIGEGRGTAVTILACSPDGARELQLGLLYDWDLTSDAGPREQLVSSSFSYRNGVTNWSLAVTSITETRRPVAQWAAVRAATSEGVGMIYEGTFVAEGDAGGTSVRIAGTFSVCHVANLSRR